MRASISFVVIAFALAGLPGGAAAQYYPPAPAAYPPPPSFPPPPAYSPRSYSQAPLPPPDEAQISEPQSNPYAPAQYVYHDANGAPPTHYYPASHQQAVYGEGAYGDGGYEELPPQPLPNADGQPALRPPGSVSGGPGQGDVTGSLGRPVSPPAGVGAQPSPVVASLPPEDQPEQGPPKELPPQFRKQLVDYQTREPAGTIIIDTPNTYLYLVLGNGKALRYGIGVGREGFTWAGSERVSRMSEWPDWHPPKEMIERQPYLPRFMAGGDGNPLGARALYLGNTLYRIHGTNQPSTIGTFVSSGCIRLTNDDIEDLYTRVSLGTRVVVLPGTPPVSASAQGPAQGPITR